MRTEGCLFRYGFSCWFFNPRNPHPWHTPSGEGMMKFSQNRSRGRIFWTKKKAEILVPLSDSGSNLVTLEKPDQLSVLSSAKTVNGLSEDFGARGD